jgi:hypothetical protein
MGRRGCCLTRWGWGLAMLALGYAVLFVSTVVAQGDVCAEPNDNPATACPLAPGVDSRATIDRPGDADAYRVEVGEDGAQVQIDLTELPADYDLYLADAFGGVYGQSVQEGTASEYLRLTLRQGTYYVYVQADPGREVDPGHPYLLQFAVADADPSMIRTAAGTTGLEDNFDDPSQGLLPMASRHPDLFTVGYADRVYRVVNFDPSNRIWGPILPGDSVPSCVGGKRAVLAEGELGSRQDRGLLSLGLRRLSSTDGGRGDQTARASRSLLSPGGRPARARGARPGCR